MTKTLRNCESLSTDSLIEKGCNIYRVTVLKICQCASSDVMMYMVEGCAQIITGLVWVFFFFFFEVGLNEILTQSQFTTYSRKRSARPQFGDAGRHVSVEAKQCTAIDGARSKICFISLKTKG